MNAPVQLRFGEDAPLTEIMSTMRTMRRLKPDPVSPELIEKLVQAATYAPTGGNFQLFSFVAVTDREQITRLAPLWRRVMNWYIASQYAPTHMDTEAWNRLTAAVRYQADHFDEVPALIVACYELTGVFIRRMLHTPVRQINGLRALGFRHTMSVLRNFRRTLGGAEAASVYPAVQNLLLTARALGLGATLTTLHLLLEQKFKAVLGIPRHVHTYAIIPIGWPRGNFGTVSRRPSADSIHWDQW